jgi:hypothetical protein
MVDGYLGVSSPDAQTYSKDGFPRERTFGRLLLNGVNWSAADTALLGPEYLLSDVRSANPPFRIRPHSRHSQRFRSPLDAAIGALRPRDTECGTG